MPSCCRRRRRARSLASRSSPSVTCRGSRSAAASRWRRAAQRRWRGGGAAVVQALLFPRRRLLLPRAVSAAPLPIKVTMATVAPAGPGACGPRCAALRGRPGPARLARPLCCGASRPVPISGLSRRARPCFPTSGPNPRGGSQPGPGSAAPGMGRFASSRGAGGREPLSSPAGRDRRLRSLCRRTGRFKGTCGLPLPAAWPGGGSPTGVLC